MLRSTVRRLSLLVGAAVLAVGLAPVPAGAAADSCTSDGTLARLGVFAADSAVVGTRTRVTVVARDACDQEVPGWTGTVQVRTVQVDGRSSTPVTLTAYPEDGGRLHTDVLVPSEGLTRVEAQVDQAPGATGRALVLVHGSQGYPVMDALQVGHSRGLFTARGITADVDAGWATATVSVRVDGQETARARAGEPRAEWAGLPDPIGRFHGFDLRVPVPTGRHSVCLYVDDTAPGTGAVTPIPVVCRLMDGVMPGPAGTVGSFDGVFPVPGGFRAAGWAIDPSRPGGTAVMDIKGYFLDLTRTTPGPALLPVRGAVHGTGLKRLGVEDVYPAYGPYHGFVTDAFLGPQGQGVRFCVVAGSLDLGCREAAFHPSPVGSLDAVSAVPGGTRVRGWALDFDTYGSVAVHVYVDGRPASILTADGHRPDVAAAYPGAAEGWIPGYGPAHGFDLTLPLAGGRHDVCAYAIDMRTDTGAGAMNTTLGCRAVTVVGADPVGHLDSATAAPGGFTLRGWTADPDAPSTPLQVHTYRDGAPATVTTAGTTRPDLAGLDGGRYGTAHGFSTTVPTGPTARLCSYAINVGPGTSNTTLGCRDLTRPTAPTGSVDGLTRTSPTSTTLRGWALDPDTAGPVDVHVYVDGRFATRATATASRPDVAGAYPGWGADHGYSLTVPATPGQQVCTYAINTLQGTSNTTLGCRTA